MNASVIASMTANIAIALGILIAAVWLGGWVKMQITEFVRRDDRFDVTLGSFFGSIARYTILAIAIIFILGRFGVETTSLAALVGASALAIGLALQGSLSNLAAGVMLIAFRPFKVGDYISAAGESGTVDMVTLFATELTTPDNVKIILPNGDVFSSAITNYSHYDTRRCDLVFGVSYSTDLKKAEKILRACVAADERVMADPEPFVKVTNLGDSSVDFTLKLWCSADDYWELKFDMMRAVKEAFDKGKIDIPFPTQTQINITG